MKIVFRLNDKDGNETKSFLISETQLAKLTDELPILNDEGTHYAYTDQGADWISYNEIDVVPLADMTAE